jgi:hypothetical protein
MSVSVSRRAFLAGGASLAGIGSVCVLVPGAAAAVVQATSSRSLAIRRSAFVPLVGQTFQIVGDRRSLSVVLRQVNDLVPAVRPGAEDQFSLVFTDTSLHPVLRQGTYPIRHARQGWTSLFVAPVDRRRTAQHYQATIDSRSLTAISSRSHRE